MATNHSAKLAVVRFQLEFGGKCWVFHAKADTDKLERSRNSNKNSQKFKKYDLGWKAEHLHFIILEDK